MGDESIDARIGDRRFHDRDVREVLDRLSLDTLRLRLGEPVHRIRYGRTYGHWSVGDGRPMLAYDEPLTMLMIGRCASWRIRQLLPGAMTFLGASGAVHGEACDWCDYPLEELLAACDWSVHHSGYIESELYIWRQGEHGEERFVTYERGGRHGVYENPQWRDWWALDGRERRHRLTEPTLGLAPDRGRSNAPEEASQ